jgi:hypothetical protein
MSPPRTDKWPERSFVATLMVCAMIDLIIFIVCVSFFTWLFAMIGLVVWGARTFVRRLAGNDLLEPSKLRKRRGYHGALNRRHA